MLNVETFWHKGRVRRLCPLSVPSGLVGRVIQGCAATLPARGQTLPTASTLVPHVQFQQAFVGWSQQKLFDRVQKGFFSLWKNENKSLSIHLKKRLKCMKYWEMTWVQWFAEASVQSAGLHPTVPLALDCHSLARGSSGRSDRSWKGWKKDRTGASSLPCPWMTESCFNRHTIAFHLA